MEKLIEQFNKYFDGKARAKIVDGILEITIDHQTLFISLPEPEIVGGCSN